MTVNELANFIRANKQGLNYPGYHPVEDESVVLQYTRHEMAKFVHIPDEHVWECCTNAKTYHEHIELCKPIAKTDSEEFWFEQSKPIGDHKALEMTRQVLKLNMNFYIDQKFIQ